MVGYIVFYFFVGFRRILRGMTPYSPIWAGFFWGGIIRGKKLTLNFRNCAYTHIVRTGIDEIDYTTI